MSAAKPPLAKRLQWRLECLVFLAAERLLGLVPLATLWRIGAALAGWAWLVPSRRRVVRDNLRTVLGPDAPDELLDQTTREVFRHTTANLLTSLKGARMPAATIAQSLEIENREVMDRALSQGKGVILVLCHMGNWEFLAQVPPAYFPDHPAGSLYRPLNNPFLDRLVTERRKAKGTVLFAKLSSLHAPIAFLRGGGILGILSDQRAGSHGCVCPLFDRLFSITPVAALLQRRTGAPVVGLSMRTTAPGKWSIRLHDPETTDGAILTPAHIAALLETMMRHSIADVFWLTDPWRVGVLRPLALPSKRGPLVLEARRHRPLQPLRVLLRVPDREEEARATLPALRALAPSRPDLELLLLGLDPLAPWWGETGIPHRFIPYRGDTPEIDAHLAIVLTNDEPAARDLPRVFAGPIYSLPEVAPQSSVQWHRVKIRKAHRGREPWTALLLSLGMCDPPRRVECVR